MGEDFPGYAKFRELTLAEERHGLLEDASSIGLEEGWKARLAERGLTIRGHRVSRARGKAPASAAADPAATAPVIDAEARER